MPAKSARDRRTFIETARRAQIVECAAEVIAESGYAGASMADFAARAGIAKSVISYHFADKNDLLQELVRTAVARFTEMLIPRLDAEQTARGKVRAFIMASADWMITRKPLHLAVMEIGFNAVGPDGRPQVASLPLNASEPLEAVLREGQRTGELGEFDVTVMADLLRSAAHQTMPLALRANPDLDIPAYARALAVIFDQAISPR